VPIEPQVFALLLLLVENGDRMVSRDEILEKVWDGRIVSDSAVDSRIKSARRLLGDDGARQAVIRTIRGQGYRFVAPVRLLAPPAITPPAAPAPARPSLAVLRFGLLGDAEPHAAIAEAIPHDLIVGLSRLRWLFVIARGSSFRFPAAEPDVARVGDALGARYCLGGAVTVLGDGLTVAVELVDARDGGVVWAERFASTLGGVHEIRTEIVARVVAALDIELPLHEARRAALAAPDSLDAWSAYHIGIRHMYRFNRRDTAAAAALFEAALARSPSFARAEAGLSFTHFQNAFMQYAGEPRREAALARRHAERALELDPLDPFANFTMGRSFWLRGDLAGSAGWLERATELNPNYAQGFYARAWTETIAGDAEAGAGHVGLAMALSPLDPLNYAMQAVRALGLLTRGDPGGAAAWADRAARAPGAHVLIAAIAAASASVAGNDALAQLWAAHLRRRRPDLGHAQFFAAFPFPAGPVRTDLTRAFVRLGL